MTKSEKMRKTKIICTIGPASESEQMLEKLAIAGMNVMRLNFSHGTHKEHLEKIEKMLEVNKKLKTRVAILLDTKGPEIRTGDFEGGLAIFKKGQISTITIEDIVGTSEKFTITYKNLYKEIEKGQTILVNDGQLALVVMDIKGTDIICKSQNDCQVKNKRGINLPGMKLNFEYLSEKDIDDLTFGCKQKIDFVAASFVRRAQDLIDIKKLLIENGREDIQIIGKIENKEGIENIEEILKIADGIMIARGDLGVEVPAEDVPLIQKYIIKKCQEYGKFVITATQMLESMQENPRPTRAEVSDVANAILDGTDAIMLSGESASGKYPVEAVETMNSISLKIERNLDYKRLHDKAVATAFDDTSEAICMSVAEIASKFNVFGIVAFTQSGFTARRMSRYRPEARIIAVSPTEEMSKGLVINWGVMPVISKTLETRRSMIEYASIVAKEQGAQKGDLILVTAGSIATMGSTSYLELVRVE